MENKQYNEQKQQINLTMTQTFASINFDVSYTARNVCNVKFRKWSFILYLTEQKRCNGSSDERD